MGKGHFVKNYPMNGHKLLRQHSKHKLSISVKTTLVGTRFSTWRNLSATKQKPLEVKSPGRAQTSSSATAYWGCQTKIPLQSTETHQETPLHFLKQTAARKRPGYCCLWVWSPSHVPCSPSSPSWNPRTNSTCLGISSWWDVLLQEEIFPPEHLNSAFLKPKCLRPWNPRCLKHALRAGDVARRQDVCSARTRLGLNLNTSLALQIRGVVCVGSNTEIWLLAYS